MSGRNHAMENAPNVLPGAPPGVVVRLLERADIDQTRTLLAASCAFDRADLVAEELLFAPAAHHTATAIAAWMARRLVGVIVVSGPWVRFACVHPEWRDRGLGGALLSMAERDVAATGADTVRVADQPGNYLAPGVDARDEYTINWLTRRGYDVVGDSVNLLVDLVENPLVSEERSHALAAACSGYQLRRVGDSDRAALMDLVAAEFSPAWAHEVARAVDNQPPAVHIALVDDRPVAFAAHDGNNRGLGWFGPAGTLSAHRGCGLGAALLCACLVDVMRAGHRVCEIAWIGPRAFYERSVGVIGERRFVRLRKKLVL